MEGGKIVDKPNKLILKQGKGLGTGAAVSGPLEKASCLALGLGFQGLEPLENARGRLIRIPPGFHPRRGKLFAKAHGIKRGWPWVRDSIHGG